MMTNLIPISSPRAISAATLTINKGEVIAFPTDTVYGLGVSAFNREAIDRLYALKQRDASKALPVLIADVSILYSVANPPTAEVKAIIEHFWPGPLTLVLPRNPALPDNISPSSTIGVRIPDHPATREMLRKTGPLAATSANLSGQEEMQTAQQVARIFKEKINLILDGGPAPGGKASTVLDCFSGQWRILRPGPIPRKDILKIISQ